MLYVPRHLPNKLEYKVLSCISVHYQLRMASNEIAITPSHPSTVQAGQWYYSRLLATFFFFNYILIGRGATPPRC